MVAYFPAASEICTKNKKVFINEIFIKAYGEIYLLL